MFSRQGKPRGINTRERASINTPSCQLSLEEDEIHHYPHSIRRSIKLQQHRLRPNLHRRSRNEREKDTLIRNIQSQGVGTVHLGGFLGDNKLLVVNDLKKGLQHVQFKLPQQFQTTADRMSSMRKKLSPMKTRYKEEKRFASSVDKMRQPVQRATFLNIEKVELVKMYEGEKKQQDPQSQPPVNRNVESASDRYAVCPQQIVTHSPQLNFKKKVPELEINDVVVELRKTLKQSSALTTSKWHSSRPRVKAFTIPFERYFYKDFIWKVAFSNGLLHHVMPEDTKVKVFVGKGNNSQLVRSLIKRRGWWSFTEKWEEANFVWTQLKINNYISMQQSGQKYETDVQSIAKEVASRNSQNMKIMNKNDVLVWDGYWRQNRNLESKLTEEMTKRSNHFKKQALTQINVKSIKIHNHMSQNFIIGNKKALLYTMREYYQNGGDNVFDYLPLSFHVCRGVDDPDFTRFLGYYYERRKRSKKDGSNNVWIVKPGELTNRGNGIIVCLTLEEIKAILKKGGRHFDGTQKTFILQQYIERPFLYQRRKFDIRHFMLVTFVNGRFKGYWYKRGFIRTSSLQYTLVHGQPNVHLTNDAVQKWLPDYGKYEKGNKVSYEDFQAYLAKEHNSRYDFFGEIYPKIRKMGTDAIRASSKTINPKNKEHCFELFGLDFMIDSNFQPWFIECNSNPCLEVSCPLLASIIPAMIQNILRICVDSLVGPPADFSEKRPRFTDNALSSNEFEMVYDSVLEESDLRGETTLNGKLNVAELDKEEDEEFEDDGEALED